MSLSITASLTTHLSTALLDLLKSEGTVTSLSISASTLDFRLAKSTFSDNSDVISSSSFFYFKFCCIYSRKANSTFIFFYYDYLLLDNSLLYTMIKFFFSVQVLNELVQPFHLTYNVSTFFFITFITFQTLKSVFFSQFFTMKRSTTSSSLRYFLYMSMEQHF